MSTYSNFRTASDIMTTDALTLTPPHDLNAVEVLLEASHLRHLPVVNSNEEVVGIVSTRDILKALSDPSKSRFTQIKDIMSSEVVTASAETSVAEIAVLLRDHNIGAVPIVKEGVLKGIVSERDILKVF